MTQETVNLLNKFYTGICCACFEPITGEPFQFRQGGRKFHYRCSIKENNPYVQLEKQLAAAGITEAGNQGKETDQCF